MAGDGNWVGLLWPVGIGVATIILTGGIWWLWWRFPQRHVARLALKIRDPKARADVEDNLRKTIGQALGGIAVLIGAGAAYLQFLQQQKAAHDLLISNQVAKGFEQLGQSGSDKITLRLGGIYALEGVMNTSSDYHRPVLEALCAFVRDGTRTRNGENQLDTDIMAVLTVIGRRGPGAGIVDLRSTHFQKAALANAQLSDFDFSNADLSGADLSNANLQSAKLIKAHLSGAHLFGTNLSHADLSGADLSGLIWSGGANLSGAVLIGANLSRASLPDADLTGANLAGANLSSADLRGAHLSGAVLDGNLSDTDLDGADMRSSLVGQWLLDSACGKPQSLPEGLKLDRPCPEPPPVEPALNQK